MLYAIIIQRSQGYNIGNCLGSDFLRKKYQITAQPQIVTGTIKLDAPMDPDRILLVVWAEGFG